MAKAISLGPKPRIKDRWEERWKRNLRLLYLRLLRLRGQPQEVAGGVAIGVFVGMTPTVPLHTVLAVLIAFILKKSKLAAALGVWVANPFCLPFIYLLDFKVGQVLTGANAPSLAATNFSIPHLVQLGWDISYPLLFGGTVNGFLCAIPSYFITKRVILLYQIKRRRRKESS
ncbi:MAG: DUF2062 domain-containing protein [Deltaproteobacteria bacterium]|jgi:uncharacterized protein (DUF2062 family)|nr:DUF2062 domain-containing protein [Deltaproteobacteria bacterium]